jgi:hypothetical protein
MRGGQGGRKSGIKTTGPGPGRKNGFSGVKLEFLDSFKDAFLESCDAGAFYTDIVHKFVDRFGYDLKVYENPELGAECLKSIALEDLPTEVREVECERRNAYVVSLRKVSYA